MDRTEEFTYGWEFMERVIGADIAANQALSDVLNNIELNNQIQLDNEKILAINYAIDELTKNLNSLSNHNLNVEQLKGFVAEEWHSGTFNIDAIQKQSEHRAWTLQENGYASVDIQTNFGKEYSSKYSNTAKESENMQAILDRETRSPKYHNQERLIANEQLDEAKTIAKQREIRNILTRPEVSESHKETSQHLVGKISDDEGVESKPLSIKESKQIAKEINDEGFDHEKHGFNKGTILYKVQIDYFNQAMKAGLTAASITAITQLVPQLYKAIDYLIKEGEIDLADIKESGKIIVSTSAESFLRGSIAYTTEIAVLNGLFGESIKNIDPTIIGSTVTIILGTIKDSILVAAGKMTSKEMGSNFVDHVIVSSSYFVGMRVGGLIMQHLCPNLPFVGYALGSLIGCSLSVAYQIGKKQLISFCIDSGFTCFGLVEQNYQLPEKVLSDLGIDYIPIPKTEINTTNIQRTNVQNSLSVTQYETINITILKRGILEINKIGYII